ncbi:MAG: YajQ family cyclic di-GMP-binding protein [Pseudomonadota bacterium]
MPSFDVVSEVDMHEARNAVDQANKEVSTRFDFKGSGAEFELEGAEIKLKAEVEFQLAQMLDILRDKLARRKIDVSCLDIQEPTMTNQVARQSAIIRQGLDADLARKIVKLIKNAKMKVQCAIQGEKVRISGKKRDDLQQAIALIKDGGFDLPLQYENFRD